MSGQGEQNQIQGGDDRARWVEYVKFALLLSFLMGLLFVVTVAGPVIFQDIVPSVLGIDQGPAVNSAESADPSLGVGGAGVDNRHLHIVQEGEDLYEIARMYGVDAEALATANYIINPYQLKAGTVLIIPQP